MKPESTALRQMIRFSLDVSNSAKEVEQTVDSAIDWFVFRDGRYERLSSSEAEIYKSETFPGLSAGSRKIKSWNMTLAELLDGHSVFIDANIFIYHLVDTHRLTHEGQEGVGKGYEPASGLKEERVRMDQWLAKFARLRVDRARGYPAPHKPLLLLVVLELAEQGQLLEDVLPLSPELAFRFFAFWNVVAHRRTQSPDVRLPFHHLQSDGFWLALDENGKPSPDKRLTRCAALNEEFVAFTKDPTLRDKARRILIETYFQPAERVALYSLVGSSVADEKNRIAETIDDAIYYARQQGREARFRLTVVAAYDYACALTNYRLTTIDAGSIVDAAHIHQFADSRNNDARNGLALSKNAHWLFDQGLWTIADDYTVIVAIGQFTEQSPDQKALRDYHGQKIRKRSSDGVLSSEEETSEKRGPGRRRNRGIGSL